MKNELDYNDIAKLVTGLGNPGFSEMLLDFVNLICNLNHFSLVHLANSDRVSYVMSASDKDVIITEATQKLYLTIYYRLDPNKEFLKHFSTDRSVLIKRLKSSEINDIGYRKLWYEKMGIVDRVSIITQADKGLYCLNLFRTKKMFSDIDISNITELSYLLSSLTIKHARLAGSISGFMTREGQIEGLVERLAKIEKTLSQREKEVCARIILGMSSEGIALDLNIKVQSVHTYRKRAYARLKISSQNELFALCLTLS